MSRGAIFTLVTQDDITDKFFTAMDLLMSRIADFREVGLEPTVRDIEKSHILYTKSKYVPYVAVTSDYVMAQASGLLDFGSTIEFTIPNYGHFTSDMVLYLRFNAIGDKTAYENNIEPTTTVPLYRYCAYPGIRILENVEYRSDGILIDSYGSDDVLSFRNFFVNYNHKPGWDRCFGQDEIQQASYNSKSFTGFLNYSNGHQTPKLYQEAFEMFIPLQFWFCEDVSQAVMNSPTTSGQRKIIIKLANIDKILQSLIYSVEDGIPPNITQIGTTKIPLVLNKNTSLITNASLFVNNLYTYPEIFDIISQESNFNLIRVHKRQNTTLNHKTNDVLLSALHYPGEYLSIGIRNKNNTNDFDRWHLMGSDYLTTDTNHIKTMHIPAIVWNMDIGIRQLVTREAIQNTTLNNIVQSLRVHIGDINIYPTMPAFFFNDYMPIRYHKNSAVCSPYDNNMFLITFCLYPGTYNPSGHFNMSINRDMYIEYVMNEYGDLLNDPTNGISYEMVICMSALNFLIRDGDSIRLRYSI
jgi:hypothetical protein